MVNHWSLSDNCRQETQERLTYLIKAKIALQCQMIDFMSQTNLIIWSSFVNSTIQAQHESMMIKRGSLVTALLLLACQVSCSSVNTVGQSSEKYNTHSTYSSRFKRQSAEDLVAKPSSINLKSILEHQEGLEKECAKYFNEKQSQVAYLIKYNHDNGQVQLPNPLPVKVPAVCLFLLSYKQPDQVQSNKLEFVNWIYDEDDFQTRDSGNMTKREVEHEPYNIPYTLVGDYLLDPKYLSNEVESEDQMKFHEDIENILANDRFHQVIDKNRGRMAKHLSPVILVPGLLGSRLQVRTDKTNRVNIFCSKQSDWQDAWLSIKNLLPIVVDCWLDNVKLELDPNTGFTKSPKGVQSRVPDFGSVESVRFLDVRQPKVTMYFAALINRYEQLGYTVDKNLLAAPYDFRLAPQELTDYFKQLKALIERAQDESPSRKKVTLVCHSMGCTHLLVFLRSQSSDWRQNRVRKLIAMSSPWGGAIKSLKALVSGDQLDLPLVSELKMRKLARTYPSIAFLLPQGQIFSRTNKNRAEPGGPILIDTPEQKYRVSDIEQLLKHLNLTNQLRWYKETTELIRPLEPLPDLQVDCIHSLNVPTPETLLFRNQSDFPNGNYELIKGEGDGTVNLESLMVCNDWARMLPHKVKHTVIRNTNHVGVLSHKTTLTHITDDTLIS